MELTYAEVGATASGDLPAGYRHVRRRAVLGPARVFAAVTSGLRRWGIHRGAGLAVRTTATQPAVGVRFDAGLGLGRLRLWVPCTVVWCRDERDAYGYGFGTRPGHPESGEEAFEVTLEPDGQVWLEIRAFSRPSSWYARAGGAVTRGLQDRVTDRYVLAAQRLAGAD